MTISNSNLLKPFITGSKLLPFKDDVFSKTEEQFKKKPMANRFSFPEMKT